MVFERFAGCILRGPEVDLPSHASYWADYKYEAIEGNVYHNNGSAWVLTQGAAKSETLKNKIINFDNNTVNGVLRDPFSMNKRVGYIIPALTAESSLNLALKGLPPTTGYSLFNDPVEGYISRFSMSAVGELRGWFSDTTPFITRRDYNPYLKIRMKTSVTANMAMWVGFTNLPINLVGTSPLAPLAHGLIVGTGSGFSAINYIVRNDGQNDTGSYTTTGVPRDIEFHTFEIQLLASGAVVTVDNGTPIVISNTRLPDINTDLMLYIHYWSRDTVPKTFDIARGYFESDIV